MAQRNSFMQALGHSRAALVLMCLIAYQPVRANVTVELHGVDDELRTNVLAYLSFERYKKTTDLSADTIERLHERVEREVQSALRPFGYYEPKVHSELTDGGKGDWRVTIDIVNGIRKETNFLSFTAGRNIIWRAASDAFSSSP